MSRTSETHVLIPLCEPKDYGSAGIDFNGVNLGLMDGFTAAISFGLLTGNSILTVYAGASDAKTTAIAFNYRLGSGVYKAANSDQLGDVVAVAAAGLTLTAATFIHKHIVIEVDPDTMPTTKSWLVISIDATASVLAVGAIGIGRARYAGHLIPTVT